jgi:hypothetical protein
MATVGSLCLSAFFSLLFYQFLLNFFQGAVALPAAEIKVNTLPLRKVMGQHAPLATRFHQVKNGI